MLQTRWCRWQVLCRMPVRMRTLRLICLLFGKVLFDKSAILPVMSPHFGMLTGERKTTSSLRRFFVCFLQTSALLADWLASRLAPRLFFSASMRACCPVIGSLIGSPRRKGALAEVLHVCAAALRCLCKHNFPLKNATLFLGATPRAICASPTATPACHSTGCAAARRCYRSLSLGPAGSPARSFVARSPPAYCRCNELLGNHN